MHLGSGIKFHHQLARQITNLLLFVEHSEPGQRRVCQEVSGNGKAVKIVRVSVNSRLNTTAMDEIGATFG